FKIYVPDPVSGQVGFMGILGELGTASPPRGGRGGATPAGAPPASATAATGDRGGAAPAGAAPRGRGQPAGCRDQMNSRALSYITSIDLRRVWIADVEKGLVFGLTMFRQPYAERTRTIINPDGTTRTTQDNGNPFD